MACVGAWASRIEANGVLNRKRDRETVWCSLARMLVRAVATKFLTTTGFGLLLAIAKAVSASARCLTSCWLLSFRRFELEFFSMRDVSA